MLFDLLRDKDKKVHFIGIGGISMSGLAAVLLNNGYKVSGSDSKESDILNNLRNLGAEIYIGHSRNNIKDVDLVVYTAAIPNTNPEIVFAKDNNITLMDRAEFLGLIMKGHKYNVAVAGTHGKTTCTTMLTNLTLEGKLDPTILVGGEVDAINGNFRIGSSEYFVTEACEYKESFLRFYPYVGVILNIDADHLDYYRDLNHIIEAFKKFTALIPEDGSLVCFGEDDNIKEVIKTAKCNVITYGFNEGTIRAIDISYDERGCASFKVFKDGEELFPISLNIPGKHNVLNALASISVSLIFGICKEDIQSGLEKCIAPHKRFEFKGKKNGVTVIDDYAHHPVEIKATLSTAKKMPHKKIYCVFQPHTYTRTKTLFNDFAESFYDADNLILLDIYAAREPDTGLVSSNELGDAIRSNGVNCINLHSHVEAAKHLKEVLKEGDILLTVGAGDVVIVGDKYLSM